MPAYENRLLSWNVNLPSCSAHPSGKLIGAGYLLWLGIKVLRSRSLFSFQPASRQSLPSIFLTGLLSAALNPKPGIFVLAFIPPVRRPSTQVGHRTDGGLRRMVRSAHCPEVRLDGRTRHSAFPAPVPAATAGKWPERGRKAHLRRFRRFDSGVEQEIEARSKWRGSA